MQRTFLNLVGSILVLALSRPYSCAIGQTELGDKVMLIEKILYGDDARQSIYLLLCAQVPCAQMIDVVHNDVQVTHHARYRVNGPRVYTMHTGALKHKAGKIVT